MKIGERFEVAAGERGIEAPELHGEGVGAGDDFARRLSVYHPVSWSSGWPVGVRTPTPLIS